MMDTMFDPDVHVTMHGKSQHIRGFVWNWCHRNIRCGYQNALRVRAMEEKGGIVFWVYYKGTQELEFFLEYGTSALDFVHQVKATFMLIGVCDPMHKEGLTTS